MTTPAEKGFLIAVEGIDGAGKTTLARALTEDFRRGGIPVNLSKEPTAGPWGMQIRSSAARGRLSPEEEIRLLVLDRKQHVAEVIAPALDRGEVVILDRYYPSMAAYQGAAGIPVDDLLHANAFAPKPNVVLLLDVSPETGLARIRARGDAPNQFETPDTLAVCRKLFLSMPMPTRHVIDATAAPEDVHRAAWRAVLHAMADTARARFGLTPQAAEFVRSMGCAAVA